MITFSVIGLPMPKGSKTPVLHPHTGAIVLLDGRRGNARKAFAAWKKACATHAQAFMNAQGLSPIDGPVTVTICFHVPRPKSAPRRVTLPFRKPDLDKLTRTIADAISGICYVDDARITDFKLAKRYATGDPYAHVTVAATTEAQCDHPALAGAATLAS